MRAAELMETQRMEEQARRRNDEKNRRIKQQQVVAQAEKETAEKIAARAFARVCIPFLRRSIDGLELLEPAVAFCLRPPSRQWLLL